MAIWCVDHTVVLYNNKEQSRVLMFPCSSDSAKASEAWQRYLRMEESRVGDIFVGQLKSTLRCTHCNHDSVTFDLFWDLR